MGIFPQKKVWAGQLGMEVIDGPISFATHPVHFYP